VDPIALYYPYIHVRDDSWLKYAALYWPKMGRLRPPDFPLLDSAVAERLHRERWLIDIAPPGWAWSEVGAPFLELINDHAPALRDRFGVDKVGTWNLPAAEVAFTFSGSRQSVGRPDRAVRREATWFNPRFGFVHVSKLGPEVVAAAEAAGLAVTGPGRGGTWVGMHPDLASVYLCALTERIAEGDHLHPITNRPLPHTAVSGWSVDQMVRVLLEEPIGQPVAGRPNHDVSDSFICMAFATVVPADIENVPIEKILEIRSKFGAELDAFRSYVTAHTQQLAALEDVRDVTVFQEYLYTEVQRSVTTQLDELRERLRSVGLGSAYALADVKSVALPPLAAMATGAIGVPTSLTVPAAVAACVLTAPVHWRRQRRTALAESPVSYLFHLEKGLGPSSLIDRLHKAWPL